MLEINRYDNLNLNLQSPMCSQSVPRGGTKNELNQSVILEKHLPAPLDEEVTNLLYQSYNKPLSQIGMLKSSQNIVGKTAKAAAGGLPTMDLSKLKKTHARRNYVAVANTSRRMKEKDLLFIEQDFKGMIGAGGVGSSQTASFKKSVVNALSQTRTGFAKVNKTLADSSRGFGQTTSRSKFGATST